MGDVVSKGPDRRTLEINHGKREVMPLLWEERGDIGFGGRLIEEGKMGFKD